MIGLDILDNCGQLCMFHMWMVRFGSVVTGNIVDVVIVMDVLNMWSLLFDPDMQVVGSNIAIRLYWTFWTCGQCCVFHMWVLCV